jgi:hypothetical protein
MLRHNGIQENLGVEEPKDVARTTIVFFVVFFHSFTKYNFYFFTKKQHFDLCTTVVVVKNACGNTRTAQRNLSNNKQE